MDLIRNNFEHIVIIILSKMITAIIDQGPLLGNNEWRFAAGYAMMAVSAYRRLILPWLTKTLSSISSPFVISMIKSIIKFITLMFITRWATGGLWNQDLLYQIIYVSLGIVAYHIGISRIDPKDIPAFLVGKHELFESVILIGFTINLNLTDLNIMKATRDILLSIGLNILYLKLMPMFS